MCLELLGYGCAVVFAGLPDELHAAFLYEVEVLQHAFVHGARSEAAAYEEDGLLSWVETEAAQGVFARDGGLDEALAHGVAGVYYLLSGEEALHAVVCHAYLARFCGEVLVGYAGV